MYNNILVIVAYFIIAFEVKPDEERPPPKFDRSTQGENCRTLMKSALVLYVLARFRIFSLSLVISIDTENLIDSPVRSNVKCYRDQM